MFLRFASSSEAYASELLANLKMGHEDICHQNPPQRVNIFYLY